MSSIGEFQMSSRKPVSTARPHRFWSIEYGDFADTSLGRPRPRRRPRGSSPRPAPVRGQRDGLVPRPGEVPGGGDDLQLGRESADADLETDLVVALAGAAVR